MYWARWVWTRPRCASWLQLREQVEADYAQGLIDKESVRDKLLEQVEKAQQELVKAKLEKAAEHLWHFIEELNKETGEHPSTSLRTSITPQAADVLKDSALAILGVLGLDLVTLDELEQLREQVEADFDQGLIDKESVRDKLVEKLEKAQEKVVKSEPEKAADELDKFMETVEKEKDKHINVTAADNLLAQAQALIDALLLDDDDNALHFAPGVGILAALVPSGVEGPVLQATETPTSTATPTPTNTTTPTTTVTSTATPTATPLPSGPVTITYTQRSRPVGMMRCNG